MNSFEINVREINTKDKNEAFILAHQNRCGAHSYSLDGVNHIHHTASTCHSSIRFQLRGVTNFIGNLASGPNTQEWWDFLTSCKMYSSLFKYKGWELLTSKDNPVGFIIPDEVFQKHPDPVLLYAFLIDSRMAHDYPNDLQTFSDLRKIGVNGQLARIISRYVSPSGDMYGAGNRFQDWRGTHQIIRDDGAINWKKFLGGDYKKGLSVVTDTSTLWTKKTYDKSLMSQIKWKDFGEGYRPSKYSDQINYKIMKDQLPAIANHFEKVINDNY